MRKTTQTGCNLALCSFFALFTLLVVTGCAVRNQQDTFTNTPTPLPPSDFCVLVFDSVLAEKLSIQLQEEDSSKSQLLITRTVIKNESHEALRFYAQTFFKADEQKTIDASPVRLITVAPRQSFTYTAHTTLRDQTQRWLVYIRPVDVPAIPLRHQTPVILKMNPAYD